MSTTKNKIITIVTAFTMLASVIAFTQIYAAPIVANVSPSSIKAESATIRIYEKQKNTSWKYKVTLKGGGQTKTVYITTKKVSAKKVYEGSATVKGLKRNTAYTITATPTPKRNGTIEYTTRTLKTRK